MLSLEFILTDAHFAIGLLAGLACFATCWLYLDAWLGERERRGWKEFLKWLGYGILAIGFVVTATEVEPVFLGQTVYGNVGVVAMVLRALGYAVLAVGLILDPLEKRPVFKLDAETKDETKDEVGEGAVPKPGTLAAGGVAGWGAVQLALPVLAGAVTWLYLRRATTGLERHLRAVVWAFGWFTAFEVADLAVLGRGTDDPRLYDLLAPFGLVWLLAHVLLAVAAVVLGLWVWQYLTKRLETQLFMVLTTACLVIFLVTTVSFTFLLMSRVQSQAFESLEITAKVLNTSVAGQEAKTVADAEVVAENPAVAAAVAARDHAGLVKLTSDFLAARRQSSLVITESTGQVLLRAEDPANWGDSMSSDSQVAQAAVGKSTNGLVAGQGTLGPRLVMRAVTPMRNAAGVIVGTVAVGFTVDNAYVDGLKQTTGLASAMYSGPVRVATTLLAPDGSSRALGVKETQADITTTVLQHNNTWSGIVKTGGQTYLAVYAPLRDADNAPVGMLFIGQPQVMLLQAAGRSIELTFLIAVLLLVIAIGPVHLIARFLTRQLH